MEMKDGILRMATSYSKQVSYKPVLDYTDLPKKIMQVSEELVKMLDICGHMARFRKTELVLTAHYSSKLLVT